MSQYLADPIVVEFNSRTTNINSLPVPPVPAAWLGSALTYGTVTSTQPVDELENVVVGSHFEGVDDTFYDRILIEPGVLSLGNLLSEQVRTVLLWNGFRQPVTLEDFDLVDGDGIAVNEPLVPPTDIPALQQLAYQVTVTTDGPSNINASLAWRIEGVDYDVPITGQRLVVFSLQPNWEKGVDEELEWRTDIIRSFSGKEQRRSLRVKPRQTIDFEVLAKGGEARLLDSLLWSSQGRMYAVPLWTDKTVTTGASTIGQSVINVVTDTYGFAVGGLLLLRQSSKVYEAIEIESVSSTQIGLARPLSANWPAGSAVMPLVLAHLPSAVQMRRQADDLMVFNPVFRAEPSLTDPYLPVQAAPVTYSGYELVTGKPNWSGDLDFGHQFLFDEIDYGSGPIEWLQTETMGRPIKQHKWLLRNRAQIKQFRSLLGRLKGQQKAVYLPTWTQDFELLTPIGPAVTTFLVADDGFLTHVGIDGARRNIYIQTRAGQNFARNMTNIIEESGALRVTIDSPLGVDLAVSDVRAISLLSLYRLASDSVQLSWRTNQVVEVQANFILVAA